MTYAISAGHQKTVEAAEIILQAGGNAVDAAIAAYLVSFISEPCMASLGAGGFAMINSGNEVKLYDFFCQTPLENKASADLEFFPITVDFGGTTEDFHVGRGSIAVPGALAGIYAMHKGHGSMPMKDLAEPAKLWAKEGIAVDKFQAYDFQLLQEIFSLSAEMRNTFFHENGTLKQEHDIITMPRYSDLLDAIVHEGPDLYYKGEIASSIATDMQDGGLLTREDLARYRVHIRKPLQFDFMGRSIHTPGFPSVGGMLLTAILNTYQDSTIGKKVPSHLSVQHFQELVQAFASVQALKNDKHRISQYLINRHGISAPVPHLDHGIKKGGTSHFNIVDNNGMTVALTTSIGEGSGYFVPGTDMQMNNMLGEEALLPEGFHTWQCNTRLQSMMCPTIVSNYRNETIHALGSGGAGRIPYAISQVLINSMRYGIQPDIALDAPRIHISENHIEAEKGYDIDSKIVPTLNEWDVPSLYFGGVNSIVKQNLIYCAYADRRRYGHTIPFY